MFFPFDLNIESFIEKIPEAEYFKKKGETIKMVPPLLKKINIKF